MAVSLAGAAGGQEATRRQIRPDPAGSVEAPEDQYFAYYVRATVSSQPQRKSPTGPVVTSILITEGPMTMAQGLERAREIMRDGVCRIVDATLNTPGRATCYPARSAKLVEVFSPQQ